MRLLDHCCCSEYFCGAEPFVVGSAYECLNPGAESRLRLFNISAPFPPLSIPFPLLHSACYYLLRIFVGLAPARMMIPMTRTSDSRRSSGPEAIPMTRTRNSGFFHPQRQDWQAPPLACQRLHHVTLFFSYRTKNCKINVQYCKRF